MKMNVITILAKTIQEGVYYRRHTAAHVLMVGPIHRESPYRNDSSLYEFSLLQLIYRVPANSLSYTVSNLNTK